MSPRLRMLSCYCRQLRRFVTAACAVLLSACAVTVGRPLARDPRDFVKLGRTSDAEVRATLGTPMHDDETSLVYFRARGTDARVDEVDAWGFILYHHVVIGQLHLTTSDLPWAPPEDEVGLGMTTAQVETILGPPNGEMANDVKLWLRQDRLIPLRFENDRVTMDGLMPLDTMVLPLDVLVVGDPVTIDAADVSRRFSALSGVPTDIRLNFLPAMKVEAFLKDCQRQTPVDTWECAARKHRHADVIATSEAIPYAGRNLKATVVTNRERKALHYNTAIVSTRDNEMKLPEIMTAAMLHAPADFDRLSEQRKNFWRLPYRKFIAGWQRKDAALSKAYDAWVDKYTTPVPAPSLPPQLQEVVGGFDILFGESARIACRRAWRPETYDCDTADIDVLPTRIRRLDFSSTQFTQVTCGDAREEVTIKVPFHSAVAPGSLSDLCQQQAAPFARLWEPGRQSREPPQSAKAVLDALFRIGLQLLFQR